MGASDLYRSCPAYGNGSALVLAVASDRATTAADATASTDRVPDFKLDGRVLVKIDRLSEERG